jgi:hypothetical protein
MNEILESSWTGLWKSLAATLEHSRSQNPPRSALA